MGDYCVPYDPKIAEKEKEKKEKEKKFWRKTAMALVVTVGLFFYGYSSVASNEIYSREHIFGPDSMSSNIESLNLTGDSIEIDYVAGGDSYSTSDTDSYPVEIYPEDNTSIHRRLAQKYDGRFYDAVFDYESGVMKVTEGVIVEEEVHYYVDQIDCSIGYNIFETKKYSVDKDNTVVTTFTPSIKSYLGAFGAFLFIIALVIFFSSGEAEAGRGC